jgi:hypothetical protein
MFTRPTTPDQVEYVRVADLRIGDVMVFFTPTGVSSHVPPTARQLAERTQYSEVTTLARSETSRGIPVIEVNRDTDHYTATPASQVWIIKQRRMYEPCANTECTWGLCWMDRRDNDTCPVCDTPIPNHLKVDNDFNPRSA